MPQKEASLNPTQHSFTDISNSNINLVDQGHEGGLQSGFNSHRTYELKKPPRLEFVGYDPNESPSKPNGNMEMTQDMKTNKIPLERKRKENKPNIVSFGENGEPY